MKKPIITLLDPFSSDILSADPDTVKKYSGKFIAAECGEVVASNEKLSPLIDEFGGAKYNGRNIFIFYPYC